jgi:hypothetical protein
LGGQPPRPGGANMVTKRTPINRPARSRITAEAVNAFRRMESASDDDAFWDAHHDLHRALGLRPWQWPAILYPDEVCPYPAGSHAAHHWQTEREGRPEAFELYQALVEAAA